MVRVKQSHLEFSPFAVRESVCLVQLKAMGYLFQFRVLSEKDFPGNDRTVYGSVLPICG